MPTTPPFLMKEEKIDAFQMKLLAASCGVSKRNCAVAKPAFALTRYGAVHLAFHPCSKLQGIQAKANKAVCFDTHSYFA